MIADDPKRKAKMQQKGKYIIHNRVRVENNRGDYSV
jgi:hypothetical protein